MAAMDEHDVDWLRFEYEWDLAWEQKWYAINEKTRSVVRAIGWSHKLKAVMSEFDEQLGERFDEELDERFYEELDEELDEQPDEKFHDQFDEHFDEQLDEQLGG